MGEQERKNIKREINKDHVDYWKANQTKDTRREWDMNDPDLLKKQPPARCGDTDERLGVSCAQMFVGEDLQAGHRKKLQHMQQKSWCEQQAAMKAEKQQMEKQNDKA